MTQHRGSPGEEGHPGKPGEEGKDTGEGGRGGEGGEGGAGGPGAPQGPGGGGGEGGVGGRGARGATGPAGARGPAGGQPKLRWSPAIGYVLLALVLGFLIFRVQTTCVDRNASVALRHQWTRVAEIIDATQNKKPGQPGYIPPQQAGKLFAQSYRDAIREAGPAPDCRGLFP
jgi:hypothetical protein